MMLGCLSAESADVVACLAHKPDRNGNNTHVANIATCHRLLRLHVIGFSFDWGNTISERLFVRSKEEMPALWHAGSRYRIQRNRQRPSWLKRVLI